MVRYFWLYRVLTRGNGDTRRAFSSGGICKKSVRLVGLDGLVYFGCVAFLGEETGTCDEPFDVLVVHKLVTHDWNND